MAATNVGRFAPSTTGRAHPGTLLSALLCWLDIRSLSGRVILRLEDLDRERCKPETLRGLEEDLAWFGLDWDEVIVQSSRVSEYEAALDVLAKLGLLYPCDCSRTDIRRRGIPAPDGGYRYPNTCRTRSLPSAGGWRASDSPLRMKLARDLPAPVDEGGGELGRALAFGDPIVRRRDGAIAYHLASVVDDAASGVDRHAADHGVPRRAGLWAT